tara:strand:- start:2330 stop:3271 length:942 start_codon:yes stop_codon:yes gene_type:complete
MKRDIVKNKQEYIDWINLYNGKMNCYTTVYDFMQFSEKAKVDSSIVLDRMFMDFDSHDKPLEDSFTDVRNMMSVLNEEDYMYNIYFSGKGFHIILYGAETYDIRSIQQYFTELHEDFPTLDRTGVQTNRLRRIPNTVNLSSEGPYFCIPLLKKDFMLGLEHILDKAMTGNQKSKRYGDQLKVWKKLQPIEASDIEVTAPKPPGELPILPCLYNAIMVENPGHYARVYLTQWYRDLLAMGERELSQENKNETVEIIMNEFKEIASHDNIWLDWDENITRRYTVGIVDKGYHAPGCKSKLIPQGYCPGKCWRYCE